MYPSKRKELKSGKRVPIKDSIPPLKITRAISGKRFKNFPMLKSGMNGLYRDSSRKSERKPAAMISWGAVTRRRKRRFPEAAFIKIKLAAIKMAANLQSSQTNPSKNMILRYFITTVYDFHKILVKSSCS